MRKDQSEWDYIIVGAGSGGCVLANRLTENPDVSVLLIEAGPWDRHPLIHIPLGWGHLFQKRAYDWHYATQPDAGLNGRSIECVRGKVIGGSSSINAMTYVRGHRADFDRWAQQYSLDDWAYDKVLPLFIAQETWAGPPSPYRGRNGPLHTQYAGYQDSLLDAYLDAAVAVGHAYNPDLNGEDQLGFGRTQVTIRNGQRCSNATAFLQPVKNRQNLCIVTDALVRRIVLTGQRASAVEYQYRGQTQLARASEEIILTAGAINSPALLMHSGIGDPELLKHHGIDVQHPLKGVGKNLQDHVSVSIALRRSKPGPFVHHMRADRVAWSMARAYLSGKGWATSLPSGITGFASTQGSGAPDLQFLFAAAPFGAKPYLRPFNRPFEDGFSLRVAALHPHSRGQVTLASPDPTMPPLIHQNLLAEQSDLDTLRKGVGMIRDIMSRKPLSPYIASELSPGPETIQADALDHYIRASAATVHHPCGTCRMGADNDDNAVLDQQLRVRGIDKLRVADASAMPDLVSGNINATVSMIAERAAMLLRPSVLASP